MKKSIFKKWWFYPIVGLVIILIVASAADDKDDTPVDASIVTSNNAQVQTQEQVAATAETVVNTIGSTILFDDFEITFKSVKVQKVDSVIADYEDAVLFEVDIKNMSDKSKGFYSAYLKCFNPSGIETDNLWIYIDDSLNSLNEMRSGATQTGYLTFGYDGDGEYILEFDRLIDEMQEVIINVTQPVTITETETVTIAPELALPILQDAFKGSASVEYIQDTNTFNITPTDAEFINEMLLLVEGDASILEDWNVIVKNTRYLSEQLPGYTISLLNPANTDNTLLMVYEGVIFYNFTDE